jgi:hypothetical protein
MAGWNVGKWSGSKSGLPRARSADAQRRVPAAQRVLEVAKGTVTG